MWRSHLINFILIFFLTYQQQIVYTWGPRKCYEADEGEGVQKGEIERNVFYEWPFTNSKYVKNLEIFLIFT